MGRRTEGGGVAEGIMVGIWVSRHCALLCSRVLRVCSRVLLVWVRDLVRDRDGIVGVADGDGYAVMDGDGVGVGVGVRVDEGDAVGVADVVLPYDFDAVRDDVPL